MSEAKQGRGEAGLHDLVRPLHAIDLNSSDEARVVLKRFATVYSVSVPEVVFASRGKSFGRYYLEDRRLALGPRGRELGTLLHEFAHHVVALQGEAAGVAFPPHGKRFKEVLRELCLMAYGIYALPLPPEERGGPVVKRSRAAVPSPDSLPKEGEFVMVKGARHGNFRALVLRPKRTRAFVKRISDGALFDVPFALITRLVKRQKS